MIVDEKELRKILNAKCKETGSQRAWAKKHKLDDSLVSRIISGSRGFNDQVLKAMKAKRVKNYDVATKSPVMKFADIE